MLKIINYRYVYLLLVLIYFASSVSGQKMRALKEEDHLIRQKRNLLCYLGLNDVLKGVLYDSLEDLQKHDPIALGNSSSDKLQDGILQGLSTLTNVSDLNVTCDEDGLVFATTLGLKNALVHYKWKRKYLINFDGTVWSRADDVRFDLEVKLNLTCEVRFEITKLLVVELDGFRFGFSGLGPLNPLVKGFVKLMNKVWHTRVTKIIEKQLRRALEKQLSKLTISFKK